MSQSCIILDLDSTLINTFDGFSSPEALDSYESPEDVYNLFGNYYGVFRPGISQFLETCFSNFDQVCVWSAGTEDYVAEVVSKIKAFSIKKPYFVWSREYCVSVYNGDQSLLQKPLSKVFAAYPNIDPKRTFILDDYRDVCQQDSLYHIHIPAWKGEIEEINRKKDNHLKSLTSWIKNTNIYDVKDFRDLSHGNIFV